MQHSKSAAIYLNTFSSGKDTNYLISINDPYLAGVNIRILNFQTHYKSGPLCKAANAVKCPAIKFLPLSDLTSFNVSVAWIRN